MVRALMKSQKEVDQAKSSNNKVASANSTKKEEKNLKKSGRKTGPLLPKAEPQRWEG
jgi:hypothetical protein